ncbi:MAG: DUF4956 domain-containing protein [Gemmataceae bacterium]|nr:DUF4956 domain-containing protein [Gemmataceae bacterium]
MNNNLLEQSTPASEPALMGLDRLPDFAFRFCLDFLVIFILVRLIYYPRHRNKDFLFSFFLFNIINFLLCYLLSSATIQIGFAFGLFAIFSVMRYRTETVPIREMGYFMVCVTLGILNALANLRTGLLELVFSNALLLALTYLLDRKVTLPHENVQVINYERIELIKPENREKLIEDLKQRTGLPVHRVEIGRIDFLRDTARVRIYYLAQENENPSPAPNGNDED